MEAAALEDVEDDVGDDATASPPEAVPVAGAAVAVAAGSMKAVLLVRTSGEEAEAERAEVAKSRHCASDDAAPSPSLLAESPLPL